MEEMKSHFRDLVAINRMFLLLDFDNEKIEKLLRITYILICVMEKDVQYEKLVEKLIGDDEEKIKSEAFYYTRDNLIFINKLSYVFPLRKSVLKVLYDRCNYNSFEQINKIIPQVEHVHQWTKLNGEYLAGYIREKDIKENPEMKQYLLSQIKSRQNYDPISYEAFEEMSLKDLATIKHLNGNAYAKKNIIKWLEKSKIDPLLNIPVKENDLK